MSSFFICNEYICRKHLALQMEWRGWYSPLLLDLRPGFESWSVRASIPCRGAYFLKQLKWMAENRGEAHVSQPNLG